MPLSVDLIKAFLIVGYIFSLNELLSMGYGDFVCSCLKSYIPVRICAIVAFYNTFPPKMMFIYFSRRSGLH